MACSPKIRNLNKGKKMDTIHDIRKALKPLGFNIKTKTFTHGTHAEFIHMETGQVLSGNVFSKESVAVWRPLFVWRTEKQNELRNIQSHRNCYGLV